MAIGAFQVPRGAENGYHSPHTVIIMRLRGELLRAQLVGRNDLHRHLLFPGTPTRQRERRQLKNKIRDSGVIHGAVSWKVDLQSQSIVVLSSQSQPRDTIEQAGR